MGKCSGVVLVLLTVMVQIEEAQGGSRILMIPYNMNSHLIYFSRLGLELARLGDEVTMVLPSNNKLSFSQTQEGFEVVRFKSRSDEVFTNSKELQEVYYKYAMDKSLWDFYKWYKERLKVNADMEGHDMVSDKNLMSYLKNKKYDFIIFDLEPLQYFQLIAKVLKVPYGILTLPYFSWFLGIPRLPSTTPNTFFAYPELMNFKERLSNFLLDMFFITISTRQVPTDEWKQEMIEKFSVEITAFGDFHKNASLYLYLEDPVVGYPRANMPYSLSVGDIMAAQPASPLPQDLALFLQQRPTILVSFGSFFSYLPPQQTDKFCRVFTAAKELNFVWKFKNASVCGEHLDNLLIRSWLPQNDLLASSAGFITHGGFNSVMEAVSNAVPLVLFPIAVDQHYQANLAEDKGFGIQMDIAKWEAEELLHNVRAIVTGSYKEVVARHSAILKHRPLSAAQRVSHAVAHVAKFGSDHMKSASMQLNWFQLFMFDVFLFLLVLVCVLVFVAVFVAGCLITKLGQIIKSSVVTDKGRSAKPKSA